MDKKSLLGMLLLGIIFVIFNMVNQKSAEEQAAADKKAAETEAVQDKGDGSTLSTPRATSTPSQQQATTLGLDASGAASFETLSSDLLELQFSSKGGRLYGIDLKNYKKSDRETNVKLLDGDANKFSYQFAIDGREISTGELNFAVAAKTANSITYRLQVDSDSHMDQIYTLKEGSSLVDYELRLVGMDQHLTSNSNLKLDWKTQLIQQESDIDNERYYTGVYFRDSEGDNDNLSDSSDDEEDLNFKDLEWIGLKQQFFNQTLISEKPFKGVRTSIKAPKDENDPILELTEVELALAFDGSSDARYPMQWYLGANDYDELKAQGKGLENMVYLGWTLFRWVNLGLIIPIFNFLGKFIGNYGIIIFLLTLLIKTALFPLTFKQFKSMAAMKVIQPEIAAIKEKFPDDMQRQQQETMKLYSSAGVNPLGGCLPMLLQFPILLAMYSFFPTSLQLRQESFLWAQDLSTYDSILTLPFEIPFYGWHVSLFTILTAAASMAYSRLNSSMQSQDNPQVKMMMYVMPFFLLFIFNKFAAALTFYYFLYNIFSMAQHFIIKKFFVNDEQIRAQISENKKKPQKQSSFQKRLEDMMKQQQQKVDNQQSKQGKNKK